MRKEVLNSIRERKVSTPYYCYDLKVLSQNVQWVKENLPLDSELFYAVKANSNGKLLDILSNHGFGADCVSGNEILTALAHGFKGSQIVFAGVGKTDKEINIALDAEIKCFNVESFEELEVINEIAIQKDVIADIALRINPNVNAKTHHFITTGLHENKFGISIDSLFKHLNRISEMKGVALKGVHFHIGSQIADLTVYKNLCNRINDLQDELAKKECLLDFINVGGGLGINYENPEETMELKFKEYFGIFNRFLKRRAGQKLFFELGRSIIGNVGVLVSEVTYVKKGEQKSFVILDAGMTELIRPALYQAFHQIENVSTNTSAVMKYDIVGPICESSDCFGKDVLLKETKRKDIIVIKSAGAYAEAMSFNYNLRNKPEVLFLD